MPCISRYTFETIRSGREFEGVAAWTVMGGIPVGTTTVIGPQAERKRTKMTGTKTLSLYFILSPYINPSWVYLSKSEMLQGLSVFNVWNLSKVPPIEL